MTDALEDRDDLISSPLIVLDTAHDGVFERQVYDMLDAAGYEGLLLLDDINLNTAMQDFWRQISREKIDLTPIGHWSGTGLARFAAHADETCREPYLVRSTSHAP